LSSGSGEIKMRDMTFKKLAGYFEKLESTASRNSMVEILARLFGEASPAEIGQIVYLTQGRVAPFFEPVEFGMAEKMVLRALAQAYEVDLERVAGEFKKSGDLGVVAEALAKGNRGNKGAQVNQVFEKLYEITQAGGEGSVEKKVTLLCEILKSVDSLSARFVARIPVDKMRLGFSDMTVLDALSWMVDGSKKNKAAIEAAYNIRPDLGEMAKKIKIGGIRGIRGIRPKAGTPILVMRAERLTSAGEILEKAGNPTSPKGSAGRVAVEPKLDGLRLQLHFKRGVKEIVEKSAEVRIREIRELGDIREKKKAAVELFSRGLENVTAMYPDIVAAAEKEFGQREQGKGQRVDEVILDGEAIGFDPKTGKFLPFQETVQRKRKYDIPEFAKNVPLRYVVFDCLYLNGESLIDKPYLERQRILGKVLGNQGTEGTKGDQGHGEKTIVAAEMTVVEKAGDLEKLFGGYLKKGLEGIMAKKLDGVYQAGARGWNWIKLKGSYTEKLADTVDAVVMGIDYGQGKRNAFGVGAFLIGVYDAKSDTFKTISKVGTGLTDQEWKELAARSEQLGLEEKPKNYDVNKIMNVDVWMRPELVGEFKADELTKSPMHTAGFALRFPRLVRWREKKAEDTTTVGELVKLKKLK